MSGAFAHPGHAAGLADAAPLADAEAATDWDNYEKLLLTKDTGEPIDLAVMPDSTVLHTARNGVVRLTDPTTGQTSQVAQLDIYANSEDGLQGVALDPDFEENGWVYLVYAPRVMSGTSPSGVDYPETTPAGSAPEQLPEGADPETYWNQWLGYNVLSRFQWDGETRTLDLASEQEIIKIDAQRGQCCHVGADMAFDGEGNLYLSSGDNTPAGTPGANGYAPNNNAPGMNPGLDSRRGAGSTNDLRGAILRIDVLDDIAPDAEPGPGSTYEIPAGNLFDSEEYDADLVREEIYVMGLRNPFRIDFDVESGALVWGDYGPDAGAADPQRGPMGYVEWQLTTEPMNGGWPFCHGPNDGGAYNEWDFATATPGDFFDCAAGPVNNSTWNTGLEQLPPVTEPQVYYGDSVGEQPWDEFVEFTAGRGQAPMGGPIFRYDAENDSAAQFPEYWDGKAFFAEFSKDYVAALSLDELSSAGVITQVENFLPNAHLADVAQPIWDNVMDMEFGPDGSLYVLEYGDGFFRQNPDAGLYRVDYAEGNKTPQGYVTANPISSSDAPLEVEFDATASRDPEGESLTYEWDFEGTGDFVAGEATASYTYDELGQYDVTLRVTDPAGKFALATVQVTVGNTAPEISVDVPNGAFFSWGDDIPVSVTVTDAEDDAAAGGEPAERNLTASSTIGAWLDDSIGGPILLEALGIPASALAQAAGIPLQDLIALSEGALTQAMVDAVLAAYADAPDAPASAVDCNRVTWTFGLGHNEHAHPEVSGRGCDFTIETNESAQEHGEGEKLYGTLVVTYTDNAQGDVPAATGEATLILKPVAQQAEWFDSAEGIEVVADASAQAQGKVASFDEGDWFAYTPISFHHAATGQAVDTVTARATGEGTLSLRWDDAEAEPFAEVTIGAGEGWQDVEATFDSVPNGSGTVYVTSTGGVEVDALTFSASGTTPPGERILVPVEKVSLQMFSLIPWVSAE
ncbi:PQQ-dependent sugar dehydrogenase, partial [Georgenia sp. MJ206]|uniref:PQQ-dependent sugar dehydrogenase n=1 Tax=Georgenia wangjunii TaxID=3117730 RepID=UPI002F25F883